MESATILLAHQPKADPPLAEDPAPTRLEEKPHAPKILFMGAISVLILGAGVVLFWKVYPKTSSNSSLTSTPQSINQTLSIVYDQPLATYEPTVYDTVTRSYLVNVYEGLVRFDRNLNIEPALALSWGMFDDRTWQFKLRPDVTFHDGSTFEAQDVYESFERARSHPESQVQSLISSIEEVKIVDDLTLQISTQEPDPILPNKLTALFIIPSGWGQEVSQPIGTGPYAFSESKNSNEWNFKHYEKYWGEIPTHSNLRLMHRSDKFERHEAFTTGQVDVLAQVPPVFVKSLLDSGVRIASQPSLEAHFLMFNWKKPNSALRHKELRQAITHAFDPNELMRFTSGFAHPIDQFVSRGIFGYAPDIEAKPYDLEMGKQLVSEFKESFNVTFDVPEGLEVFAQYVQTQLGSMGINVQIKSWPYADYSNHIASGESEFFFLGWRSELGDASDFFENVIRSENGYYQNPGIDEWIERTSHNLLESERREEWQKLMMTIVDEEIVGVPLFETDILTAIQPSLQWEPRVDNLILAADFK